MKKTTKTKVIKNLWHISLAICLCFVFAFLSSGADDDFEKQLSAFPESYKPYLRELHAMYPEWVFEPFVTNLDFYEVVDNEMGAKSLVDKSAATDDFKSKEIGDYNYTGGYYIEKDGGFVAANRFAVEFFIDPRNFLNEEGIFQFEDLSFNSTLSVASVEAVLKGSFMYNATMDYYNASGKKVTVTKKYSEAIFEAGKKYNVNPCYLASKIRNEVGSDGSGSTSGKHSTYPGIYNYYNIGAYDGTGAITKGLKWASSGTSYSRPWTSPEKSIMGGAQYIAEKYIAIGQYTGYLQRFNVNADTGKLYEHQYMTNLTGALSQGYTNYNSYAKMGLLSRKIIFSIPVYENMPSQDAGAQRGTNADSITQEGTVCVSGGCNVRTGPSTSNAKVLDKNGNTLKLPYGHKVEILEKVQTDSQYYLNILQYPFWAKIKFTYNSGSFIGYVPVGFIEFTTTVKVPIGEYTLPYIKGDKVDLNVVSHNPNIAKVASTNKVEFLKEGTVYLLSYDSLGRFEKVKYEVVGNSKTSVDSISASRSTTSIKYTASKLQGAQKYLFTICDTDGNILLIKTFTDNVCSFGKLTTCTRYSVYVKCQLSDVSFGASKGYSTLTLPAKVQNVKAENISSGIKFIWSKVTGATGYYVRGYDAETDKYTNVTGAITKTTAEVPSSKLIYDAYYVRAYVKDSLGTVYGSNSDKITVSQVPLVPENIKATAPSDNGFTLSWDYCTSADGYRIYQYLPEDDEYILVMTTLENSAVFDDVQQGSSVLYKIQSYSEKDGEETVSAFSDEITAKTLPKAMSKLSTASYTATSATVKWSEVQGADLYRVYRVNEEKNTLVAETKELSSKITSLSQFTKYTFRIVPCVELYGEVYEGEGKNHSVITKLSPVTGFTAYEKGTNYIKLKWNKNPSAVGYEVFLYDTAKKAYVSRGTTSATSAKIKNLKNNTTYKFKIRVKGTKDSKTYYSDYSSVISAKTGVPMPTGLKATNVKSTSYKLSWSAVSGATSYNIYRKSGSSYKKLTSVKTPSYSVTGLSAGAVNYYKITAVMKIGSKNYESAATSAFSVSTVPSKPASVKASADAKYATVSWGAVKGATSYNVYVYESAKGSYRLLRTVTGTSYKVTALKPVTNYKIAVRAYIKTNAGTQKSSLVSVSFMTRPVKVAKVSVSSVKTDSHVLSWEKSSGANFYYIDRYNPKTGKYTNVGATSKTSYTVKSLVSGTTYKYKITAALLSGGKCIIKAKSSAVYSFTTAPVKVTGLKTSSVTSSSIKLTWSKVSGATGYEIYYYDASIETYLLAGRVDSNSFSISNLSSKKTYKFKVRAVRTLSGKDYKGSYSSEISVKTK